MTYKPKAEIMDIIMPLARELGMYPDKVIDKLIKEAAKQYQTETKPINKKH